MNNRITPTRKDDCMSRLANLEFGNILTMWNSVESLLSSNYNGYVTIRSRLAGGPCLYRVFKDNVVHELEQLLSTGVNLTDILFNESAPDDNLLYQGELMHNGDYGGYYLYGSSAKLPMRKALVESGQEHRGLQALGRLRYYCNPTAFDMLMDLLDTYTDGVIEFSAYDRSVGIYPGNNVLIWEVRNY